MEQTSKNNLSDLNSYLFTQLERLGNEKLKKEEIEYEVVRTNAIVNVSEQIINGAKIALDCAELVARHGVGKWEDILPVIDIKPRAKNVPDYRTETIK